MKFDWTELAFGSKKPINQLAASFIIAPREISVARFAQLVKTYLPKGNIVLGVAKEAFVDGLAGQEQFRMLSTESVQSVIDRVNKASPTRKIYTLAYFQRELPFILEKLTFRTAIGVNGSWHHSFHLRPEFYILAKQHVPYELVSPFASETEAQEYAEAFANRQLAPSAGTVPMNEHDMLALAAKVATQSFDYTFQTGTALGRKAGKNYQLLATSFNKVVPYQTYAMHHGNARETQFSPANDLNHYDTIHAETALIITAQKQKLDLRGTTLFINLLPCPTCSRMLAESDIVEIVYSLDHSDGYALNLLSAAGKNVRRVTT